MRVIVFYDLPMVSTSDLKEYRKFRKFLIKSGFIMLQESVYSKLALNHNAGKRIIKSVRKNKPKKGNIVCLTVTEKQYNSMELILGEKENDSLESSDRLVIL